MEWNYLGWIIAIIGIVGFLKSIYQLYKEDVFNDLRRHNSRRNARRVNQALPPNVVGPMVYYATNAYGLSDSEYRFKYVKVGNAWRAYIKKMPDLRGRDSNGYVTHRYWDDDSQPYVCWDTPVLKLSEIQAVSKLWADNIQQYIATGKTFG